MAGVEERLRGWNWECGGLLVFLGVRLVVVVGESWWTVGAVFIGLCSVTSLLCRFLAGASFDVFFASMPDRLRHHDDDYYP